MHRMNGYIYAFLEVITKVDSSSCLLSMIPPCMQDDFGDNALAELPYNHGSHIRGLFEGDQTPCNNSSVGCPVGRVIGYPVRPLDHLYSDINK